MCSAGWFVPLQYGEKSENAAYGKEFMNAMTYFTQHSLSGKPSLGKCLTGATPRV